MVGSTPMGDVTVRWAGVDDVAELVRLRGVMFDSMAIAGVAEADRAMAEVLAEGLVSGTFFAAVVDGDEPGRLAACGVGMTAQRIPGPHNPSGRYGYVQSMVTDEAHRGRGFARAVLELLMTRFAADGVVRVDLHATDLGARLYRSMGFTEGPQPELRWSGVPRNACE
jgi:ribosomal protein S18 acetylase RimI-like enzyme